MSATATVLPSSTGGRRRAALLDVAVAAAALLGSLAQIAHGGVGPLRPGSLFDTSHPGPPGSGELDLASITLAACSTLPLVAWRRAPRDVFTATAVAAALLVGLGYPLNLALGPAAALYLLAANRSPDASPWTARTGLAPMGLFGAYVTAAGVAEQGFPGTALLHTGLAWAAAWFAGERTRLRRQHIADLHERALRAEREADRERRLAAAEERARIARDLHDSAGHAINVIAVRAGAARLRHRHHPDDALPALEAIEGLARQTAQEIDQIVGSLRDAGPAGGAVEAPPGMASLDTLIAHHTAAGLVVTLDTPSTPRPLAGPADQAAYRILQEALTNAARHGTGNARIQVLYGATDLRLTVTNPVPTSGAARAGGGHGLVGMQERATFLGGELTAERTNGTFQVHARIPYGGQRP